MAQFMQTASIVFLIALGVGFLFALHTVLYAIFAFLPGKKFRAATVRHRFAILVPARNESKVIRRLLESIEAQEYPRELFDVYVVVEDAQDPTVEICREFGAHVTVRRHLELKGKGHALDELLQDMYATVGKGFYEAYYVFDADNMLTPSYLSEMNKAYDAGYKMALGYRNVLNWNEGWVAANSGLTFSMLNTFQNKFRSHVGMNVLISGTGFYIDSAVIDEMDGWQFHSLTEDVELSLYSILHNLKSTYVTRAEFFDEQPVTVKESAKQRIRWIRGFEDNTKVYRPKLLKSAFKESGGKCSKFEFASNILPVIIIVASAIIYGLICLGVSFIAALRHNQGVALAALGNLGVLLLAGYLALALFTLMMVIAEGHRIDLRFTKALSAVLTGPLFFAMYLPLFIKAMTAAEVRWDPILHGAAEEEAEQSRNITRS